MTSPPLPRARIAGLDGLRALAVLLVVLAHLFPAGPLRNGYIGVDVFFVLSGFLITSLLLRESARHGRIRLRRFWARRARRLLPALVAVVTVSASLAWVVGGDVLVDMGRQVVGAATFSYNWVSLAGGTGYFAATDPELFRNLWSLAVEEQFYLVWPLVLPLFLLLPGRRSRTAVASLLAAASAAWAVVSLSSGADLTRVYFGTDTHAFGLLLGVALAFLLQGAVARRASIAGVGPVWGVVVGSLAVAGLVATAVITGAGDAGVTFPLSSIVASLLTAVAVAVAAWPGSWFGRALDIAPLRWIGERSYAIYLWHWPLVVLATFRLTGAGPDVAVPVSVGLAVLVATLALSAGSYHWLEQPVRRHGFRGALRLARANLHARPARRLATLAVAALAVVALGGTTAAVAVAPAETSSETAVDAGRAALEQAQRDAAAHPAPTAQAVDGSQVTAVGDSVMLASAPGLLAEMPGIDVDAEVSRSLGAGARIIENLAASGALRPYVVVGLGTNGPVSGEALQRIVDAAGPERSVILVNAFAPRDWIPGVNRDLTAFAAAHPRVVVADWAGAIAGRTDLLAADQIHPGAEGGAIFARTVREAVAGAETQRATAAWAAERTRTFLLELFEGRGADQ
ncbi:acyltransferase family protein [Microbacterium imperiale]|uniref:Acyltransferase n=1 Tax=Microbacterium imperiale TaxID=33884 RepID=A0A9W6HGS0_9MICO|nr:acyltransferase family protein [Microbacterium imperiale]MBP2420571.1 peptidoglycan/LPS O-acetylase OafA/YrhL/lysophospholipase L1-like esterase [Microbacterium imperiale]MDS0200393.1 acetyltransferase [Microbacterium imperiale]BFE40913.1 acyltransferase family protein [Microbacterium imperiale]GLJ79542.1 acyltransferase [Microbacterium imperiale]